MAGVYGLDDGVEGRCCLVWSASMDGKGCERAYHHSDIVSSCVGSTGSSQTQPYPSTAADQEHSPTAVPHAPVSAGGVGILL